MPGQARPISSTQAAASVDVDRERRSASSIPTGTVPGIKRAYRFLAGLLAPELLQTRLPRQVRASPPSVWSPRLLLHPRSNGRSATEHTKSRPQAAGPAPDRSRGSPRADSAITWPAPSSRRPRARGGRSLHRYIRSRSGGDGRCARRGSTGCSDRVEWRLWPEGRVQLRPLSSVECEHSLSAT